MATQTIKSSKSARERILEVAEDLFYRQGYQATGINQIIDESGVAKATFYAQFPSKDALCLTYLKTASEREVAFLKEQLEKQKTPYAKFMCLIESIEPWLKANELKGCAFLNMIPEVTDPKSPIRKQGIAHYAAYEGILADIVRELIADDKKKYGHLKPAQTAKDYMLIMTGAIALSELYHTVEPMTDAVRMVKELLK